MNIIAIIMARGGSKSIPRKNVLPLHGKPLVAWPIDLAKSVSRIKRVILTTDDDEIMKIGKKHGAEVLFKRPAELSDDVTPTVPVLKHCVTWLKEHENYWPDFVILLYPTAPFLKKRRIEQAIDLFEKTKCHSVIGVVKDWGRFWKAGTDGVYKPLHPEKRVNRQYYKPLYREDGSIYFSKPEIYTEMDKLVDENSIQFIEMEEDENVDIDNPSDLVKARSIKK